MWWCSTNYTMHTLPSPSPTNSLLRVSADDVRRPGDCVIFTWFCWWHFGSATAASAGVGAMSDKSKTPSTSSKDDEKILPKILPRSSIKSKATPPCAKAATGQQNKEANVKTNSRESTPSPKARENAEATGSRRQSSNIELDDYQPFCNNPINNLHDEVVSDQQRTNENEQYRIFLKMKRKLKRPISNFKKFDNTRELTLPNPGTNQLTLYHLAGEKNKYLPITKYLWKKFGNANHLCQYDRNNTTPLHLMAQNYGLEGIEFLLSVLSDEELNKVLYTKNSLGTMPIHHLACNTKNDGEGFVKVVERLGSKCLSVTMDGNGATTAVIAAMYQNVKVMEFIAKVLPSYYKHICLKGYTVLHHAAANPNFDTFKMILKTCGQKYFTTMSNNELDERLIMLCEQYGEEKKIIYLQKKAEDWKLKPIGNLMLYESEWDRLSHKVRQFYLHHTN